MRVYVSRKVLVAMAGLVWIAAGANILKIGIYTWMNDALQWQLKLAGAVVIFCLFFFLIFKRLHGKHTRRIAEMGDKNHPLAFFDAKGWLVMLFMIGMGISIRTFHLLPNWFIAFFYTGLSTALVATGFLFLLHWWKCYN